MTEQDEIWERDDMIVDLRARVAKLEVALEEAEAVLSIVMPRSNAAEYRRVLGVVRAALKDEP